MSESAGFNITNGIFKSYNGPDVEVLEIPDGVTVIGEFSLRNSNIKTCKKIVFPASVMRIEDNALSYNWYGQDFQLEELEFLGGIHTIEEDAFNYVSYYDKGKVGAKKLTFHGHVGEIKARAFRAMKITELNFPAGVDIIGKDAFSCCSNLKEIHAPGLKKIGNEAFYGCKKLEVLHIPDQVTMGEQAFTECDKLKQDGVAVVHGVLFDMDPGATIPDGVHTIDKYALEGTCQIPVSVRTVRDQAYGCNMILPEGFLLTDEKLGGKGLMEHLKWRVDPYHYDRSKAKLTREEVVALHLFQTGKQFEDLLAVPMGQNLEDSAKIMVELLSRKGKAKHYLRAVEFIMAHPRTISPETIQALYDVGVAKKYKKELALLAPYLPASETEAAGDAGDICAPWRKTFNEHLLDKAIKSLGLKKLDNIPLADGSGMAPEYLVKCAIAPYADVYEGKPKHISGYARDYIKVKLVKAADEAATLLDREALRKLLESISLFNKPQAMLPYCRYADNQQITKLISDTRSWADWYFYGTSGRQAIIIARGALMLSDTREAMMYLDKCGCLDAYAAIRGTDADSIRDTVLADFGLDAKGQKVYDLGGKTVMATLAPDLSLHLLDVEANKVVKSLPKKGSDPDKHAAASANLSDMKKNLKKVVKGRNDILFQNFLDGQGRKASSWKHSYLNNPVLNMVARLLVWAQGKNTFILTEDGPVDCNGDSCPIAENGDIRVAHPIEMSQETVKAWQQFICSRGIVQPFEQMWEPARVPKTISKDRYAGCEVSVFKFMGKAKHGIHFEDENFHDCIGFWLEGCELYHDRTNPHRHEIGKDETFRLGKFTFRTYSRKVNHLVYLLDKWTMQDRILKDDVSILNLLEGFTVAQISEFIRLASENQCTHVLAALMEYQNQNFADFDPMEEFSLDL